MSGLSCPSIFILKRNWLGHVYDLEGSPYIRVLIVRAIGGDGSGSGGLLGYLSYKNDFCAALFRSPLAPKPNGLA